MPRKSTKESLPARVLAYIRRHCLTAAGETVIVGVSGGPDSVCLLHVMAGLRTELGMDLHVAHLDHMLRGEEARADADFVAELAASLGLPFTVQHTDVEAYRSVERLSLEEAARKVRYRFLAGVAQTAGSSTVAVGHTADDQAETILMRLLRGTGVPGLYGMQACMIREEPGCRAIRIVRPLLETTRAEVEAYLSSIQASAREDSSNLSHSYFRNRIRRELLPILRKYNPRVDQALLRMADTLSAESDFLDQHVDTIWGGLVKALDNELTISRDVSQLHVAVQRRLLRKAVREVLGSLEDIELKHIEKMREAFTLPRGKKVILPRGLVFEVGDLYLVYRKPG